MAEVRRLTEQDMPEAIRLSDATFRDAEQPSMGEAFPYIFADSTLHLSYGAYEDGKLVSFMGLVPWEIRVGESRLRVLSLGSVCTAPEVRGKGYASDILGEIGAYARRAGASLLLVSGSRSLYTRTGCAPFGRVRRCTIGPAEADKLRAGTTGAARVREMTPDDLFALQEIAAARPVHYRLGVNELATLLKAEAFASIHKMKHRVLVSETGGTVTAFAVFGVPQRDPDKPGFVVEQAGEAAEVARLCGEAVARFGLPAVSIPVPWQEEALQAQLEGVPSTREDHSGTVRIIDGDALTAQLQPWLEKRGEGGAGLRLTQTEDGNWLLEGQNRGSVALSAPDLVRLIFDCASAESEPLPAGAEAFRDLFPVPLPNTAGLCYI